MPPLSVPIFNGNSVGQMLQEQIYWIKVVCVARQNPPLKAFKSIPGNCPYEKGCFSVFE